MMAAKWNKIVIPEDLLVSDKFVSTNDRDITIVVMHIDIFYHS